MIFKSKRLEERREGLDELNEITRDKSNVVIVHYSCESFTTSSGKTPRITSICIRYIKSGQTKSFSIHLQAQFSNKNLNQLNEKKFDELEFAMLKEFKDFIKKNTTTKNCFRWIHWNMRDSNYGFEAIENRFKILSKNSSEEFLQINDDRKHDFPRILIKIYTDQYERHKPDGKMLNLASRNNITKTDALPGKEEAEAFKKRQYLELHKSTLRKVDIIENILVLTERNELKTDANDFMIYGITIPGLIEIVKNNWFLYLVWTILLAFGLNFLWNYTSKFFLN